LAVSTLITVIIGIKETFDIEFIDAFIFYVLMKFNSCNPSGSLPDAIELNA